MRMIGRMLGAAALAGALGLSAPASAVIINLTVGGGGIDRGQVCTSVTCGVFPSAAVPWQDDNTYGATGSISIDDDGTPTITFSLFVDSSSISGAAINGVSALTFDDATYTATGITATAAAGPLPGQTVYTIGAAQNASLSVVTLVETGGGSAAYVRSAIRVTGSCIVGAGTQVCGFTFGAAGTPSDTTGRFYVGGVDFALERYVRQTFDLTVVPEPGTVALLGFGLLGLAGMGRVRSH
jgi:hypothetical protein